jgi:stage II sporulation protein D
MKARRGLGPILLFALALGARAETSVSIRLYSLHPQQRVRLAANTTLHWRTCQSCSSTETAELIVQADGDHLRAGDTEATQVFVEGQYRIEPQQGMKIVMSSPLQITASEGLLRLVAFMALENYVAAVLEGESATLTQPESLKAMAVAVRSYAARFRPRHGDEGFDFCDNTHCQNVNFTGPTKPIKAAVEATRGELLWFQGVPAATYYHQNCGGTLAAGEEVWPEVHEPYLREHTDPYCKRGAPLAWKTEFSRSEFEKALRGQGLTVPEGWSSLTVESRGSSGRALRLAFHSPSAPPQMISASSLRFAVGRSLGWNRIRSDLYEVENSGSSIIFNGRGAGHGVGLCQGGAEEMGRQGKTYKQILAFYYPGTELGATAQGLVWRTQDTALFQLKSTQPDQDGEILTIASQLLNSLQSELAWTLDFKVQIRVFPTLETYRNTTGQPGWIAAYTRGHVISLQPSATLKSKGILESTLRHELVHLFVESRARADTPLWFREGMVIYLSNPSENLPPVAMTDQEMEAVLEHPGDEPTLHRVYAAARTRVAQLIEQNGRETVLRWLSAGLPGAPGQRSSQH